MINDNWLSTNDVTEIISSLKGIERELSFVFNDIYVWEIVLILLHNALQATMVSTLRKGSIFNVVNDKSKKLLLDFYQDVNDKKDKKQPSIKLLNFKDLYTRIKSDDYLEVPYQTTKESDVNIERLNRFRNEFVHFVSSGWSVEVSMFPMIIKEVILIIRFLTSNKYYLLNNEKQEIIEVCEKINIMNEKLIKKYVA